MPVAVAQKDRAAKNMVASSSEAPACHAADSGRFRPDVRPGSRRSRTAGARPPVSSLAGLGSLPVSGALRSQGRSKSSRISDNPGRTPTLTITFNTMTRDKSESVTLDTASGLIERDPAVTRSRPGTDVPAPRPLSAAGRRGAGGPASQAFQ